MTPDLAEIRAALAAATPPPRCDEVRGITHAERVLVANAPTWLAALCDEIERLRAENGQLVRALHGEFIEEWANPDLLVAADPHNDWNMGVSDG